MQDMPFFFTNEKWYAYDYKRKKYILTEQAPQKAQKSYEEFYKSEKQKRSQR